MSLRLWHSIRITSLCSKYLPQYQLFLISYLFIRGAFQKSSFSIFTLLRLLYAYPPNSSSQTSVTLLQTLTRPSQSLKLLSNSHPVHFTSLHTSSSKSLPKNRPLISFSLPNILPLTPSHHFSTNRPAFNLQVCACTNAGLTFSFPSYPSRASC